MTILQIQSLLKSSIQFSRSVQHPNYFGFRNVSTSSVQFGKRNFRQLFLANKRGTRFYKEARHKDEQLYPDIPIYTDVKPTGTFYGKTFQTIPEMIPDIIVPDLKNCNLKPYVSYRVKDIVQEEFTAKTLFSYVYEDKIRNDFKKGKLNASGESLEPSFEEQLTPENALQAARKTGSDLFSERVSRHWECLEPIVSEDK